MLCLPDHSSMAGSDSQRTTSVRNQPSQSVTVHNNGKLVGIAKARLRDRPPGVATGSSVSSAAPSISSSVALSHSSATIHRTIAVSGASVWAGSNRELLPDWSTPVQRHVIEPAPLNHHQQQQSQSVWLAGNSTAFSPAGAMISPVSDFQLQVDANTGQLMLLPGAVSHSRPTMLWSPYGQQPMTLHHQTLTVLGGSPANPSGAATSGSIQAPVPGSASCAQSCSGQLSAEQPAIFSYSINGDAIPASPRLKAIHPAPTPNSAVQPQRSSSIKYIQIQPQLQPQLQFHLQPQLQLQSQFQPQVQPQFQPQLQLQPQIQSQLQPQLHLQSQPQPQLQIQPQPQIQLQSQPHLQLHTQPRPSLQYFIPAAPLPSVLYAEPGQLFIQPTLPPSVVQSPQLSANSASQCDVTVDGPLQLSANSASQCDVTVDGPSQLSANSASQCDVTVDGPLQLPANSASQCDVTVDGPSQCATASCQANNISPMDTKPSGSAAGVSSWAEVPVAPARAECSPISSDVGGDIRAGCRDDPTGLVSDNVQNTVCIHNGETKSRTDAAITAIDQSERLWEEPKHQITNVNGLPSDVSSALTDQSERLWEKPKCQSIENRVPSGDQCSVVSVDSPSLTTETTIVSPGSSSDAAVVSSTDPLRQEVTIEDGNSPRSEPAPSPEDRRNENFSCSPDGAVVSSSPTRSSGRQLDNAYNIIDTDNDKDALNLLASCASRLNSADFSSSPSFSQVAAHGGGLCLLSEASASVQPLPFSACENVCDGRRGEHRRDLANLIKAAQLLDATSGSDQSSLPTLPIPHSPLPTPVTPHSSLLTLCLAAASSELSPVGDQTVACGQFSCDQQLQSSITAAVGREPLLRQLACGRTAAAAAEERFMAVSRRGRYSSRKSERRARQWLRRMTERQREESQTDVFVHVNWEESPKIVRLQELLAELQRLYRQQSKPLRVSGKRPCTTSPSECDENDRVSAKRRCSTVNHALNSVPSSSSPLSLPSESPLKLCDTPSKSISSPIAAVSQHNSVSQRISASPCITSLHEHTSTASYSRHHPSSDVIVASDKRSGSGPLQFPFFRDHCKSTRTARLVQKLAAHYRYRIDESRSIRDEIDAEDDKDDVSPVRGAKKEEEAVNREEILPVFRPRVKPKLKVDAVLKDKCDDNNVELKRSSSQFVSSHAASPRKSPLVSPSAPPSIPPTSSPSISSLRSVLLSTQTSSLCGDNKERVDDVQREVLGNGCGSEIESRNEQASISRPPSARVDPATVTAADLSGDPITLLICVDGLFYTGCVRPLQPPDIYSVLLTGERQHRPAVYTQEQLLRQTVREVRPSSMDQLVPGTRVLANWSSKLRGLFPGTVSEDPWRGARVTPDSMLYVEFDDGDAGYMRFEGIRLLPPGYPTVEHDDDPLDTLICRRRRISSGQGGVTCLPPVEHSSCVAQQLAPSITPAKKPRGRPKRSSLPAPTSPLKPADEPPITNPPAAPQSDDVISGDGEAVNCGTLVTSDGEWQWLGKGVKRPASKAKSKRCEFSAVQGNGEVFRLGDCAVFLSVDGSGDPYIGRIQSLWETPAGRMMLRVSWFYRPHETLGCHQRHLYNTGALFSSPHTDENCVQSISHGCRVVTSLTEYQRLHDNQPVAPSVNKKQQQWLFYEAGHYNPRDHHIVYNKE